MINKFFYWVKYDIWPAICFKLNQLRFPIYFNHELQLRQERDAMIHRIFEAFDQDSETE